MKKFHSLMPVLTLLVIILVSFSASCDKRNPPPVMPEPIEEISLSDIRIITSIKANPEVIYADNNVTFSTIEVQVKDGDNFGVTNQTVNFKTDLGNIITNVGTDSTGVARSTFWDAGDTGLATITAIVRKYHESVKDSLISADTTQVQVLIEDIPPIGSVKLEINNSAPPTSGPYEMSVNQQVPVSARPLYEDLSSLPDNSLVTFSCTKGKFVDTEGTELGQEIVAKTLNGKASALYNSGTRANTKPGEDLGIIKARIGTVADSANVLIKPDRPAAIELKSFLRINDQDVPASSSEVGSSTPIFIQATLTDAYANECQNQIVKFTTNLGTFANTADHSDIPSNDYGLARVQFTPGLSSGAATIRASANNDTLSSQIVFTIASDQVHSMDFTQEDAIHLNVANTGGASSAILRVKLRDINYNLVDSPNQVSFRIANTTAPVGANLNNQPAGEWVTVTSNGGEAQVAVNAGTEPGVLLIEANCVVADGDTIRATKPNVIIHAGPPHTITPFMSGFSTGEGLGGGVWRVVAGAHVRDLYNNPVLRNTMVWFSIAGADAQIEATGTVGNVSVNDDSLEGVAYTIVTYHGTQTNKEVTITARSLGADGLDVIGTYTDILPLNEPQLRMAVDPRAVHFGANNNPASTTADVLVSLLDGQGVPITGSEILLFCMKGRYEYNASYGMYCPNPTTPQYVKTIDGVAKSKLRVYNVEFPEPDPGTGPAGEVVLVEGWIVDTNTDLASANLQVWSHEGAVPF